MSATIGEDCQKKTSTPKPAGAAAVCQKKDGFKFELKVGLAKKPRPLVFLDV
jgi:hypothetical protein